MNIVFPKALKKMKIGNEFYGHMVIHYWPKIVGKNIAVNVFPVKVEFKKLFLNASHPAWANQLTYMKKELIDKINSYMGEFLVDDIIFTKQRVDVIKAKSDEQEINIAEELRAIKFDNRELEEIKNAVSGIENDSLRDSILRVYENDKRLKKYRISKGWISCPGCGTLISQQENLCYDCRRAREHRRIKSIRKYLLDFPWSRFCDISKDIECDAYEVNEQRIQLMQKLASRISMKRLDCIELQILTMLYKSVRPEKITQELVDSTVSKFKFDFKDYFSEKKKRINKGFYENRNIGD